jgi:plasmid replication initiation protein
MSSPSAAAEPSPSSSSPPPRGSEEANRDTDDIVVKANQLIRGRINWTKLEHRVVAMLVAQLKREDDAFEMQRVHISDLMDMSQTSSRDIYNRAEEVCRKLLNQKVHVRTRTEDGRRMYQGYNCLSTCRYVEGSGYIEAKFNDDMKPFLLQLKRQFTMYRLQNFMQLSSQHSMRMYELIKMREGLRHLCLSVEELREVLCCEHTYERFSDFRRHVLERARTEIKETCDAYYTYVIERNGRTPVRARFLIHRNREDGTPPLVEREGSASAEDQQETNGVHSEEQKAGGTASNGSTAASPASPKQLLRKAERQYNLYASVLSRLGQDTLDDISRSTVHSALRDSREAAASVPSGAGATTAAEHVVRSATEKLQG